MNTNTYGPEYDAALDGERIATQLESLQSFMSACYRRGVWVSLAEIEEATGIPQSSASAQLRHLRKPQFGGHTVDKRRRQTANGGHGGTWEYLVVPK
jgi:hypothetical protein